MRFMVILALRPSGDLKRETPLDIASKPVREDPPFANARSKMKTEATVSKPEWCPSDMVPDGSAT